MKLLYKYVFIICIFLSFGQSQKIQPEITNKKQRLIILPSEKGDDESSIQYQLVEIVADEATQLGRYNVFNRQDLKKILERRLGIVSYKYLVNIDISIGSQIFF